MAIAEQAGATAADAVGVRLRDELSSLPERDRELRAWTVLADPDTVLAGWRRGGVLDGATVGIKDIIDTADLPTERGSVVYAGRRPALDAFVVQALRNAGALVAGKTVTTEFAMREPGPTRNPHDLQRTPGGSSSGSGAAVAAGHVPLALGTQTSGSLLRPASYCGVFGLKPTMGSIDRAGVHLHCPTLDTVGMLAADPALLATALRVVAPLLAGAPSSAVPVAERRLVFLEGDHWSELAPAHQDLYRTIADHLRAKLGNAIPVDRLPVDEVELLRAQKTITAWETARTMGYLADRYADALSPHTLGVIERGRGIAAASYEDALATVEQARASLAAWFADHDAVLAPTTDGPAPLGLTETGDARHLITASATGLPALSVPGATAADGLPVGLQVLAPHGADQQLVQLGAQLTEAW